jgi:hypothetical protein
MGYQPLRSEAPNCGRQTSDAEVPGPVGVVELESECDIKREADRCPQGAAQRVAAALRRATLVSCQRLHSIAAADEWPERETQSSLDLGAIGVSWVDLAKAWISREP